MCSQQGSGLPADGRGAISVPGAGTAVPWQGMPGSPSRRDSPVLGYSCVMCVSPALGLVGLLEWDIALSLLCTHGAPCQRQAVSGEVLLVLG